VRGGGAVAYTTSLPPPRCGYRRNGYRTQHLLDCIPPPRPTTGLWLPPTCQLNTPVNCLVVGFGWFQMPLPTLGVVVEPPHLVVWLPHETVGTPGSPHRTWFYPACGGYLPFGFCLYACRIRVQDMHTRRATLPGGRSGRFATLQTNHSSWTDTMHHRRAVPVGLDRTLLGSFTTRYYHTHTIHHFPAPHTTHATPPARTLQEPPYTYLRTTRT